MASFIVVGFLVHTNLCLEFHILPSRFSLQTIINLCIFDDIVHLMPFFTLESKSPMFFIGFVSKGE